MASNSDNRVSIINKTAPNTLGEPRVDLNKRSFDALVFNKSYEVYVDKVIKCPCRRPVDNHALSDCKNCGGSGYVYVNRIDTRIVLQSMNLDTKFKEWSEENIGTVRMSHLQENRLSFMDRITIRNTSMISNVSIHGNIISGFYNFKTIYPILTIEYIALFVDSTTPLKRLEQGVDYEIVNSNYIKLDAQYNNLVDPTITIRYNHNPQYSVIDLTRGMMTIKEKTLGTEIDRNMPLSCVARLTHYVIDEQTYNNDFLLDNSYQTDNCNDKPTN